MPRFLFWIGFIFASIGGILVTGAVLAWLADQRHAASASSAPGIVVQLNLQSGGNGATYAPVVDWTDASGKRHLLVSNIRSNPPAFERGEKVTVLYDPEKPSKATIDTFGQRFTGILIFGGIGLVFALIGGPILYLYMRRQRVIARLKRSGERIEAKFLRCDLDASTAINGRNPYRVHAQGKHPKTGRLASFISEPIMIDLTGTLEGQTVPVLVDRKRYRDHFVVLDEWVAREETV